MGPPPSPGDDAASASASAASLKREVDALFAGDDAPTVVAALRCTRLGGDSYHGGDLDAAPGPVALALTLSRSTSGPGYDVRLVTLVPAAASGRRGGAPPGVWAVEEREPAFRLQAVARVDAPPPNAEGEAVDFSLALADGSRKATRAYAAGHTLHRNTFLASRWADGGRPHAHAHAHVPSIPCTLTRGSRLVVSVCLPIAS